jgi:hypothetical protein
MCSSFGSGCLDQDQVFECILDKYPQSTLLSSIKEAGVLPYHLMHWLKVNFDALACVEAFVFLCEDVRIEEYTDVLFVVHQELYSHCFVSIIVSC